MLNEGIGSNVQGGFGSGPGQPAEPWDGNEVVVTNTVDGGEESVEETTPFLGSGSELLDLLVVLASDGLIGELNTKAINVEDKVGELRLNFVPVEGWEWLPEEVVEAVDYVVEEGLSLSSLFEASWGNIGGLELSSKGETSHCLEDWGIAIDLRAVSSIDNVCPANILVNIINVLVVVEGNGNSCEGGEGENFEQSHFLYRNLNLIL